jgi:tetratricopeptide (TPR) repeat protein
MKKVTLPVVVLFAVVLLFPGACQSGPAVAPGSRPTPVPGPFQSWADANGNGILELTEIDEVADAALDLFTDPHAVRTAMDAFFDIDADGTLDTDELWCARAFFQQQLFSLSNANPWLTRHTDFNDDGIVDEIESRIVTEYLFVDPIARDPHQVDAPIDRRVDLNSDGWVDADELFDYRLSMVRAVALTPSSPDAVMLMAVKRTQEEEQAQKAEAALAQQAGEPAPAPDETIAEELPPEEEQPAAEEASADQYPEGAFTDQFLEQVAASDKTVAESGSARATVPKSSAPARRPAATRGGDIELAADIDEVFPVFHKYYDDHPIGTATIRNSGTAPMEKIKVQLIVRGYMTEKKPCKGPDRLDPGEEAHVELYALFTKDVLDISEPTKALANISVEYSSGGQARSNEFVETVSFMNRNNMTWDDNSRVAAFVTANDKSVMMFRSAAVTVVDQASSAVDAKLRMAMALHEALRLYGMKYWADPKSSFESKSKTKTEVDYLQFPEQSLQLKTGDCDDLSILYAALLEASSVDTAFLIVPGHIYIAFELQTPPVEAKASYLKWEDLIIKENKTWVPLEVTSVKEGFLKAWETGAKEWRDATSRGQGTFLTFEEARKKYAPVGFSSATPSLTLPAESALAAAYKAEVKRFIEREIATQVASLTAEIKKSGGKPDPVNRLGVLYARYGLNEAAESQFSAILKAEDYVPALVNLGNIAFLKGDARKALEYYTRAQKKEPDRATVLLGIARANHELENYGQVQEAFSRLKVVDAKLASNFTYLDLRGTEATRAADIGEVTGRVEWDVK